MESNNSKTNIDEKSTVPKMYKAYIGKGNNSIIVKNILKYRNWWSLLNKYDKEDTNFVWTQWLKSKYLAKLPTEEEVKGEEWKKISKVVYNRLEGNFNISNK